MAGLMLPLLLCLHLQAVQEAAKEEALDVALINVVAISISVSLHKQQGHPCNSFIPTMSRQEASWPCSSPLC